MQKDILAKLLAAENITVVHENAPTASFNVRDRVLTLPLWEVGHALYTPEDGWHDAVCERGRAYKSFLNVIEDARIERLIQNKYPGLRRNFIKSYRKLFADGFFGANLDEINEFDLIDRINTYFKLGETCGVRIEKDELNWIQEIKECTTWEQVVDIADRLFAQEKAKKEEEREQQEQEQQEMMDEGQTETEEGMSDGMSDSDWEMEEDNEQEDAESQGENSDEDADAEEDETDSSNETGEGEEEDESSELIDDVPEYSDEPISKTEEALHDNIRKEFNNDSDTKVYNLRTVI
jgi:cobalamin biosynthesis protein CobT